MEKVFQMRTFKDRINFINKSFPNFWRVQCRSYSSAFISLHMGLNFSITSKTLPNKDIIATIEDAVKDLEKEQAHTIRSKVSLTLQNSKPPKDNLSKDECKTLKKLQSDTSIVTLQADLPLSLTVRTI